jgi:hypothetical protein
MATRLIFDALSAQFPSANFPEDRVIHTTERRRVLAFDTATRETCQFRAVVPQGWTGTPTAVVSYAMASATTGGVAIDIEVEAVTSGDALNLASATSYDAVNTGTDSAVPATAGYMEQITITLTNADSLAAGDIISFRVSRNVTHATDTAAGDLYLIALEIRDAA